ncbi:MAG: MFS transporter [Candidatus Wallbacteria bacterium]
MEKCRESKENRFKVISISLFRCYYLILSVLFYAYVPIYFEKSGFTNHDVGIFFAVQSAMSIIVYLPSGIINDKFSVKTQLLAGISVFSTFLFLLPYASNFWHFFGIFVLWGLAGTTLDNSTNTIYYKESSVIKDKLFFSLYGITSTVAYALGGKIGAIIVGENNFIGLFKTIFYLSLALFPLWRLLSDTRASNVRVKDYVKDIWRFEVLALAATIFLFTYHWGAEMTSFTMLMKQNAGLQMSDISYIYFEVGIIMSVIIFFLGYYKEKHRINPLDAIFIASGFSAFSQLTFYWAKSFEMMLFNQFLHSIGDAFFVYFWLNAIPQLFSYERIGGASSFVNWFSVISVIAGSFFSGAAVSQFGNYYAPFIISGLLMVLTIPIQIYTRFFYKNKINEPIYKNNAEKCLLEN